MHPRFLLLTVAMACGPGASDDVGDTPGVVDSPGDTELGAVDARFTPLRRLNRYEIGNSLFDVLPEVDPNHVVLVLGEADLPHDDLFHNLDSYASAQVLTPTFLAAWHEGVVELTAGMPPDGACHGDPDAEACVRRTLHAFAEAAWRRPLEGDDLVAVDGLVDTLLAENEPEIAVELGRQAILQAPRFLYLVEAAPPDGGTARLDAWELASRLSYLLTDGPPDARLRAKAADGSLVGDAVLEAEARRLLGLPSARAAMSSFVVHWMQLDDAARMDVDRSTYHWFVTNPLCLGDDVFLPRCEDIYAHALAGIRNAMIAETHAFVEHVWFDAQGTLPALLTTRQTVANPVLDPIYFGGEPVPEGDPRLIVMPEGQRAGVLTLSGVLGGRAHYVQPSPVKRGVVVLRNLLCLPIGSPPPGVNTSLIEPGADPITNRQRYDVHSQDPTCAACHAAIDGIGFAFENYDSLGRWRDLDNGQPVDASGVLNGSDVDGTFTGAVELAERLASSRQVHDCATRWAFRQALGRDPLQADDVAELTGVQEAFWSGGGDLTELMVRVVLTEAFRSRTGEGR